MKKICQCGRPLVGVYPPIEFSIILRKRLGRFQKHRFHGLVHSKRNVCNTSNSRTTTTFNMLTSIFYTCPIWMIHMNKGYMNFKWELSVGNVLTVELRYRVLGKMHRLMFYFSVTTGGTIRPLDLTSFFRRLFFNTVFLDVFSCEFQWIQTKCSHLEGSLKLSEEAVTSTQLEELLVATESLDTVHRLRVSLTRYNQNTPIYFFLYGIRENPDTTKMGTALLEICQEDLHIQDEVYVRFSRVKTEGQVSETQFVVGVICKKEPLPAKQQYKLQNFSN